jgi:hypothetical protein
MLFEVACLGEPARATPLAQLQRAVEVAEFDAEARQRRERVDDEPVAIDFQSKCIERMGWRRLGAIAVWIRLQPRISSRVRGLPLVIVRKTRCSEATDSLTNDPMRPSGGRFPLRL